jgi:trypsin-like peptidase/effector-associated domain 1 (EAD1)-containing protein
MSPTNDETEFEDALIEAFSLDEMRRMLRRHLGFVLDREIDVHRGTRYIFADVVDLAIREGWRDDLVRGALSERSRNSRVRKAGQALGVSIPVQTTDAPSGSVKVGDLDAPRLQKAARERGVVINFAQFLVKLQALGRRLCSIEVPTGNPFGTGWLVASDLVLTNYHVIKEVHKQGVAVADVTCRFDYFAAGADGVPCGLSAAKWLEDWSPYALADERADAPDPTIDELDYALIRLARAVGSEEVGDTQRGWVAVPATPSGVIADDIVVVPQFPDGRSLELSFGKALQYNQAGTRLRYDANTEGGASGSPAVTIALEPFGLHHAAGPTRSQKYNQCVPLRLVIQRMVREKIVPFWQT